MNMRIDFEVEIEKDGEKYIGTPIGEIKYDGDNVIIEELVWRKKDAR
ncbi:MAG TPA: hypothetical protein PKU94_06245 [Candidatus Hydrothermia bacterium]|nr:hypothetical protein [Candidatus Hydrothermia bacterium]